MTEEAFCARFLRFVAEFVKARQQWETAHGIEKEKASSAGPSPAAEREAPAQRYVASPVRGARDDEEEGEGEGGRRWKEKLGNARRLRRGAPTSGEEGVGGGEPGPGPGGRALPRKADPVRPNMLFTGWGSAVTGACARAYVCVCARKSA